MKPTISPFRKVGGIAYFPRMLEKIRIHAEVGIDEDYVDNLGQGMDKWLTEFLHVDYEKVKERTLQGGTDEEILEWCIVNGRPLNKTDIKVWNAYLTKLGWNDSVSQTLTRRKAEGGFADRDDIVTMGQYIDADEGRS